MSLDTMPLSRRRLMQLLAVGGGALAAAGLLPSAIAAEVAGVSDGDAVVKGGTRFANVTPEPAGLVAGINISSPAVVVSSSIFDGLVYDKNYQPQPQLAQSWEQSEDGKTITFHLRKGVKWHDGHPFTAADVQYSILNVVKKTHPRGAYNFAKVTQVETPDDHTVVLRLTGPAPVIWSVLFGDETFV